MPIDPELKSLTDSIEGFSDWNHADKIRLFAWFLQAVKNKPFFVTTDISACYDSFGYERPNISQFLKDMAGRKPPVLLRRGQGFVLEGKIRANYDGIYGQHETTIAISKLLADLPGKISNQAERLFLSEAITCYRNRAFRAAIIMTWNLTYDHLLNWILADAARMTAFQSNIAGRIGAKRATGFVVAKREDFEDLKESETLDICGKAKLFASDNTKRILEIQLTKRNLAAHPSLVTIGAPQAEDAISDLVNNVVLVLV